MDSNKYRRLAQETTLEIGATHRGEAWTPEDVEYVETFGDVTALELAQALGRTEYGVEYARQCLLAGVALGGGRGGQKAPVRPLSDRVYTFIGGDVPEGW